jgi:Transposase and inactivated derivatives
MSIDKDILDQLMDGRSPGDLFGKDGVLAELTKALAERALRVELDTHLIDEHADLPPDGHNHPTNRRNGSSQKTVTTDSGKVVLDIPRDRNGSFDPLLIAKYQRRFPEFDTKIVSMYARGMTTREIQSHIEEIYGIEASPSLISAITDAVMDEVTAWQNRPLEPCYPVVFMDAIRVKIRTDGVVMNKAVFVALAILPDGTRDVLGLWFQANEGAKFWAKVLSDLRNRWRPGHPDCCRRRAQGLPPGHRGRLPADPGPDVHRASLAPLYELRQLQGSQGRGDSAEGGLYGGGRRGGRGRAVRVRGERPRRPLPGHRPKLASRLERGHPLPRLSARGPQADLHHKRHRGAELENPPRRPNPRPLPKR